MVPLINSLNLFTVSPLFVRNLNFPLISSLGLVSNPRRRRLGRQQQVVCFNLVVGSYSGFAVLRRGSWNRTSWCCGCKGWESDGDATLEAEILEFMQKSEKPDVFPTKRELLDAGRMDLVKAIKNKGGWWSLGWESDDEDVVEKKLQETETMAIDYDFQDFQRRVDSFRESNSEEEEEEEEGSSGCASAFITTSQSPSSSGRSLEIAAEEDTGIEGILSRLEKQRNLSFGIDLGKGYVTHASTKDDGADMHFGASTIAGLTLDNAIDSNQLSMTKGINNNSGSKLSHNGLHSDLDGLELSVKPDMWRAWSIQRAGYSDMDFEAAEISYNEHGMEVEMDASKEVALAITQGTSEAVYREKEINHNQIQNRLQALELELASALCLLRSKGEEYISKEDPGNSFNDLRKLSDAWEFQENEIMNAQDRLRTIRAKLAVLEGKMAVSIIDAQKIVEEKQKMIDGASKALQLLRTSCIIWPNSASEVLLAGSFDGWTTQKKLQKSSTGIFSVCLKLYPGRYEIKFIVDGIWRIDPLRPIVHNNGHDNNLLIVA